MLILGVSVLGLPFRALAQRYRMPRIGVLTLSSLESDSRMPAFVAGLRDLGYIDGKTITIEWRSAQGRAERLAAFAAELVRLEVDVIVAVQPQAVDAARIETSAIPIVFAVGQDPVGMGFAQSLSRPGGNITGHSSMASDVGFKQLELLRAAIPDCRRLAVVLNPTNASGSAVIRKAMERAGKEFGMSIAFLDARAAPELEQAFDAAKRELSDAIFVGPDAFFIQARARIAELGLRHRIITLFLQREHVAAGGTFSYGPNVHEQYRRTAFYVDRILRGAKPGDLPIEQPTKFELIINLKTAKALGLALPQALLLRADELIR